MSDIVQRLRRLADRERPYGSLPDTLDEAADTITALTARVAELEAALRPLACTCEAESQDECSRSEKHCPFWTARAAITKGESRD